MVRTSRVAWLLLVSELAIHKLNAQSIAALSNWPTVSGTSLPDPGDCAAATDLNGDGILDLITCKGNVYLGSGDGVFSGASATTTLQSTSNSGTSFMSVATGDVNQDGHQDVVFGDYAEQDLTFLGTGSGAKPCAPRTASRRLPSHALQS